MPQLICLLKYYQLRFSLTEIIIVFLAKCFIRDETNVSLEANSSFIQEEMENSSLRIFVIILEIGDEYNIHFSLFLLH